MIHTLILKIIISQTVAGVPVFHHDIHQVGLCTQVSGIGIVNTVKHVSVIDGML